MKQSQCPVSARFAFQPDGDLIRHVALDVEIPGRLEMKDVRNGPFGIKHGRILPVLPLGIESRFLRSAVERVPAACEGDDITGRQRNELCVTLIENLVHLAVAKIAEFKAEPGIGPYRLAREFVLKQLRSGVVGFELAVSFAH